MRQAGWLIGLGWVWAVAVPLGAQTSEGLDRSGSGLIRFTDCRLVPTDWADGDSFRVALSDGSEVTVRLYGVDCLEWHVGDPSDARRLRAQRRYFGISEAGDDPAASIAVAKDYGRLAAERVAQLLETPFSLFTAGADAGGSGRYKRIYGYVVTSGGRDLASVLVEEGLARAFGVSREDPQGEHRDEVRARLADLELTAATLGRGIWALTDWAKLPEERRIDREEDAELAGALDTGVRNRDGLVVDPNSASRDLLMELPGIGEVMADRIIETREEGAYRNSEDLMRVSGIGEKTVERIRPFLVFPAGP